MNPVASFRFSLVNLPRDCGAFILLCLLGCAFFLSPVSAQELGLDDIRSGTLLLQNAGEAVPAHSLTTDIEVDISGLIARVNVTQTFENNSSSFSEAVYLFPLPEDAAVDTLLMRIGERVIEGEIQPREEAQAIYEAAKEAGQRASLVEQERPNLFTTSVANIAPGERVEISIAYQETLRYDEGTFSFRFPLAITPRYTPQGENAVNFFQRSDAANVTPPYQNPAGGDPEQTVTLSATLNAGLALESLRSPYHDITVLQDGDTYRLTLNGPVAADRDFELTWKPQTGDAPQALAFSETWQNEPYALLLLLPPSVPSSEAPPRELVFIIDTSGSMEGVSVQQAKAALKLALGRLRPEDSFNIIAFNDTPKSLFRISRKASPERVSLAERFVDNLRAEGGTEMRAALELALLENASQLEASEGSDLLRQVVFMTDGSVSNEAELLRFIENQLGNSRLFTVGIGSAPNSYFMRKAAEFGRGSFTFISDLDETQTKMTGLFEKLESPVLTGLSLDLPRGSQAYPATVPDLYAGEPVIVSVKLPQAEATASLSANLNGQAWSRDLVIEAGADAGVSQLWARAKLEALSDKGVRTGQDISGESTEVALTHHLVSDYTSLVAVDKTPVRPAGEALNSEELAQTLPEGQNYEAIFGTDLIGFANTSTSASLNFVLGLAALLSALILLVLRRRAHRLAIRPDGAASV